MRRAIVVALLGFVLLAVCPPVFAASFTFTTIDVPFAGACCTAPQAINKDGEIVGSYQDSTGATHGFLDVGSNFTTFDVPGAIGTSVNGVNDRGEIVGSFTDGSGSHGFVKFKKKFTSIDFPGALSTAANGINKRGQIVGSYQNNLSGPTHGFLRSGSQFSTIDVPQDLGFSTRANAIDDDGKIVGSFQSSGIFGFLDDNNVFTKLDFSFVFSSVHDTEAQGIKSGMIVGSFLQVCCPPPPVATFGFAVAAPMDGTDTLLFPDVTLQFPGAPSTFATGINSEGQIVGFYTDSGQHAFLAIPQ